MRRTRWQFSLFALIVSLLFISLVNAAATAEEGDEKHDGVKTITTTTRRRHHSKTRKTHHKPRPTTTINNCSLAHKKTTSTSTTSTKLSHTHTVYVCKPKTTTTTKKHRTTKHSQKHHTTTKKKSTLTKHSSSKKTHSSKKKSHSKKITTTKKKHTKSKTTSKKSTTSTTRKVKTTTTPAHKFSVTTTIPVLEPVVVPTPTPDEVDNNDNHVPVLPTTPTAETSAAAVAAAPAPAAPTDNNNQVNSQSVDVPTKNDDAQPQSKVIGVSIGAVVGCIAAAGLAGMFIYRRREKNDGQDPEDLNQTSEVNTRWRTQSFMAVVAGAVAKLPKRSNSSASSNGRSSFNVLGSIRRAASNASRSLSVRSGRSTRSSVQSYGIAVSGPIPAIARIDGDQAQYYGEPSSPTDNNRNLHTHAY